MEKFKIGDPKRREFSKENPYSKDDSFLTNFPLSYIELGGLS